MSLKQPTHPPVVAGGSTRRKAKKARSHAYEAWQLPSGKRLAEFALDSGFLVPPLMESDRPAGRREKGAL